MKRSIVVVLSAGLLLALTAGPALAWRCPLEWKAAEDAIKKAESLSLSAEAKALLADAKKLVAEAKRHHENGSTKVEHAYSMWKARAALAQAEAVITISQP
jgi:hypothetical protein